MTDPHPEGSPVLAAATEAILRRRLAAAHGTGSESDRRAAILLDALPDAAAAIGAAAPLIAPAERGRIRQLAIEVDAGYDNPLPGSGDVDEAKFADLISEER